MSLPPDADMRESVRMALSGDSTDEHTDVDANVEAQAAEEVDEAEEAVVEIDEDDISEDDFAEEELEQELTRAPKKSTSSCRASPARLPPPTSLTRFPSVSDAEPDSEIPDTISERVPATSPSPSSPQRSNPSPTPRSPTRMRIPLPPRPPLRR